MFKLALDAGHGLYTAGKRCLKSLDTNETREWWLNNRICNKVQEKLADYDGIEVLRVDDTTGEVDVALANRCRTANNWKADFYLSIHHNAGIGGGVGGGFEVYRYIKLSANGETARKQGIIADELVKAGVSKGNRSSNIKTADFAVLRDTNMEAALIECAFMDSATDVPVLLTDDFAERVANACVNAIVIFGKLTKKTPEIIVEEKPVEEVKPEVEIVPEIKPEVVPEVVEKEEKPKANKSDFKKWLKSLGIKIAKTMAETAIGMVGADAAGIASVDWLEVLGAVIFSGVATILLNIKSMPESEE